MNGSVRRRGAGGMTADERTAWRLANGVAEPTLTAEDSVNRPGVSGRS